MPQSCSSSQLVLHPPRWRSPRRRIPVSSRPPIFARRSSPAARLRVTRPRQPLKPWHSTLLPALDPAQIPIAPEPPTRPPSRFPPLQVFVRRPPVYAAPPSWGRHPKTFTKAAQVIGTGRQSISGLPQKRTKTVCAANRRFVPKAAVSRCTNRLPTRSPRRHEQSLRRARLCRAP
jgi:hypothetical protein